MTRPASNLHLQCLRPVCALLICAACNMEGAPSLVNVRDSAGISIREVLTETPQPLQLTRTPLLNIPPEVPGEYAVYRVGDVVRLSDGSLVLANNDTELLFFDEGGQYTQTIGRRGVGSGEFVDIRSVHRGPGDSLYVFDSRLDQLTVMDKAGNVGSRANVETFGGGGLDDVVGVLNNGDVLMVDVSYYSSRTVSGTDSRTIDLLLYERESGEISAVGQYERAPVHRYFFGSRSRTRSIPFQSSPAFAVYDDAVFVGDGQRGEVRIHEDTGTMDTYFRLLREPSPVTADDIEEYRRRRLDDARSDARRRIEREILDNMTFPSYWSHFEDMRIAEDGRVWLRDMGPDLQEDEQRWTGFDPETGRARTFAIRGDFEVVSIGTATVVGIMRDDFDVEHVVVHGLERASVDRQP